MVVKQKQKKNNKKFFNTHFWHPFYIVVNDSNTKTNNQKVNKNTTSISVGFHNNWIQKKSSPLCRRVWESITMYESVHVKVHIIDTLTTAGIHREQVTHPLFNKLQRKSCNINMFVYVSYKMLSKLVFLYYYLLLLLLYFFFFAQLICSLTHIIKQAQTCMIWYDRLWYNIHVLYVIICSFSRFLFGFFQFIDWLLDW